MLMGFFHTIKLKEKPDRFLSPNFDIYLWNSENGNRIFRSNLSKKNYCCNNKMSESKRHMNPKFGHYDSWLMDVIKMLILENHNAHISPE